MVDRLTGRSAEEISELRQREAGSLTFNELLALAGLELSDKQDAVSTMGPPAAHSHSHHAKSIEQQFQQIDAGRDGSLAHTSLEEALTRFNSLCYRLRGTWKRMDPDAS